MTFGPRPTAQVKAVGPSLDPSIEWWDAQPLHALAHLMH
jgi:hypothetical protein